MGEDHGRLPSGLSNRVLPDSENLAEDGLSYAQGPPHPQRHAHIVYHAHAGCLTLVDSLPLLGIYSKGPVTG